MEVTVTIWKDNTFGGRTCTIDREDQIEIALDLNEGQVKLIRDRIKQHVDTGQSGSHLHITLSLWDERVDEDQIVQGGTYLTPDFIQSFHPKFADVDA